MDTPLLAFKFRGWTWRFLGGCIVSRHGSLICWRYAMPANIVLIEDCSLDGVIENPLTLMKGMTRGPAGDAFKLAELEAADAILLGRNTYVDFETYWPTAKEERAIAERINALPKYAVSTTLKKTNWNAQILPDASPQTIASLKQKHSQAVIIYGSIQLAHSLLKNHLVDEIHLMIYPAIAGSGRKVFPENVAARFTLAECRQLSPDVVLLRYKS
jgi:dihydrofolate reductase